MEVKMNTRTATLYARIDPAVKADAEQILSSLNMTASGAINLFYKQIILHRGLPFEVKLPSSRMVDMDSLSDEELCEEVMKGVREGKAGKTVPADMYFDVLDKHND